MSALSHRERVRLAINRQEPDRVPFDIAATKCTSIHRTAYDHLVNLLKFPTRPNVIWDPMQQIVLPDEDVLE